VFNESSLSLVTAGIPRTLYGSIDDRLHVEIFMRKALVTLGFNLTGLESRFANFIELQEVEEIQMWAAQFWER
jgi:hypothetical protein